jgi:6-phosphofructokinase 1
VPGINDAIRAIVLKLRDYGVEEKNILGIRHGEFSCALGRQSKQKTSWKPIIQLIFSSLFSLLSFIGLQGFYSKKRPPITLTRAAVESIQLVSSAASLVDQSKKIANQPASQPTTQSPTNTQTAQEGGTILGSVETRELVDCRLVVRSLDLWKVDMVFVVGGPGAHAAVLSIERECARSGVLTVLICVAKSIDNDILLIDRTFGFETAVEEAQRALLTAKVEASSGYRGVGLVKLMGRRSGFIAVQSVLASGLVDVCIIPEVAWRLDALLAYVGKKIEEKVRWGLLWGLEWGVG